MYPQNSQASTSQKRLFCWQIDAAIIAQWRNDISHILTIALKSVGVHRNVLSPRDVSSRSRGDQFVIVPTASDDPPMDDTVGTLARATMSSRFLLRVSSCKCKCVPHPRTCVLRGIGGGGDGNGRLLTHTAEDNRRFARFEFSFCIVVGM